MGGAFPRLTPPLIPVCSRSLHDRPCVGAAATDRHPRGNVCVHRSARMLPLSSCLRGREQSGRGGSRTHVQPSGTTRSSSSLLGALGPPPGQSSFRLRSQQNDGTSARRADLPSRSRVRLLVLARREPGTRCAPRGTPRSRRCRYRCSPWLRRCRSHLICPIQGLARRPRPAAIS